jgi:hypothetical protein
MALTGHRACRPEPIGQACPVRCCHARIVVLVAPQVAISANMPSEAVMRIGSFLLLVWLVIGAVAGGQRGYYGGSSTNCAKAGTITVTVLAGPLNYAGVNPKISCATPRPS